MIIDTLEYAEKYNAIHPLFSQVFAYIKSTDLLALPVGRHAIFGDDVFVIIEHVAGQSRSTAKLECHRQYIDIQLVLSGVDEMAWRALSHCNQPASDYNASKDVQFFHDSPETWITTPAGAFCIFFPNDTHAALIGTQMIHKAVFKIALQ
jgi:YhcH/YjgK/YiaL family protein